MLANWTRRNTAKSGDDGAGKATGATARKRDPSGGAGSGSRSPRPARKPKGTASADKGGDTSADRSTRRSSGEPQSRSVRDRLRHLGRSPGTSEDGTGAKPGGGASRAGSGKGGGRPAGKAGGTGKAGNAAKAGGSAKGRGKAAEPVTESGTAPRRHGPPTAVRVLVMALAFVGMVAFAVVLSRLTLDPSPASEELTHNNTDPGSSIINYLSQPAFLDAVKQIGGNVVLGVPFGVLLPTMVPRARGLLRVTVLTAGVMLLVELVQGALIVGRAFDVDDIILNTSGAVIGYLLIGRRLGRALHPPRRHWWQRKPRPEPADDASAV